MWRVFCFFLIGMPVVAFAQADSPDGKTLQALLVEVRALHQDLSASMAREQKSQILLVWLQIQQANVTRASELLSDARAKLTGAQDDQAHVAGNLKQLEESLEAEGDLAQQKALRERITHIKSEFENSSRMVQQCEATKIDREQQLRTEQDKLAGIESELEELVKSPGQSR